MVQPRKTLRFEGNKMNCVLRDQSLSDLLHSTKRKTCNGNRNGGRWSTFPGYSALLPSDIIDFALLSRDSWLRDLRQETVLLLDVMWPWSNQWERTLLGEKFSYITIVVFFFQAVVMPCPWNNFVCQGQEDDNQIVDCLKCSCLLILWVYIVYWPRKVNPK